MLVHGAWAQMLGCTVRVVAEAAQRGGARKETLKPKFAALRRAPAIPVEDFPKLVRGLGELAKEGNESLSWVLGVNTRHDFEVHPKRTVTIVYECPKPH